MEDTNAGLTNLDELEGVTNISGSVRIHHHPALVDLAGLNNVTSVAMDLRITENVALSTCEAMRLRDEIGLANIGGAVEIIGNDDFATCL